MPEIDKLPDQAAVLASLRRAVNDKEPQILYDQEGAPVAVVIPIEFFATWPNGTAVAPPLSSEEEQLAQEVAQAVRSRVIDSETGSSAGNTVVRDPAWQARWDTLLLSLRHTVAGLTPEEIEAEIASAFEEARQARLAGCG